MAVKFSGEYADDWVINGRDVKALITGKKVAEVYLDDIDSPQHVQLIITDVMDVIRSNRMPEFVSEEYGIASNHQRTWLGEKLPDISLTVNLQEVETPYLGGARRNIPRHTPRKNIKCKGALAQ